MKQIEILEKIYALGMDESWFLFTTENLFMKCMETIKRIKRIGFKINSLMKIMGKEIVYGDLLQL